MSYLPVDAPGFIEDLLTRKEFYSLNADPERKFRDPPDDTTDPQVAKMMRIHSHQLFVKNFMNPNTPAKRLHIGHTTGTGKTLGAISIAHEFIKVFMKMFAIASAKAQATKRNYNEIDRITPSVFVLGFGGTKAAFIRDLLKYPDFGFVSINEREELMKRQKTAESSLPDDIRAYREYHGMLKKRITNKQKGGFFKFFGYDEFVNRLFLSDDIKLTDIEAQAIANRRSGIDITLEDLISKYIADGKIQVNTAMMAMFENSIIIADEIHNTYNMNMKNNRGVAIQYVLDHAQGSVRFLSLSATPINNSPTEVVELINYLVPREEKVSKRSLFVGNNLAPGALDTIGKLTKGKISFLQDINVKYFPQRIWVGDTVVAAGKEIPYLKFIECPMSEFHQTTYNMLRRGTIQVAVDADIETDKLEERETIIDRSTEDEGIHAVPTDGYAIYDIAFPNPDSPSYGIFKSSEVKNKISLAASDWKSDNMITIKKFSAMNNIITGDFLNVNNIGKYSSKYHKLITEVLAILSPSSSQKIMIYHDRVKMSGVLLIQEILRVNGFLDEFSEPVDSTLCICGNKLVDHKRDGVHKFQPARFVVAHSDVDKTIMEQSLNKFNLSDNTHGEKYMILIGSKIIKESYDFKDIQHLFITSLPINIPTLIQVLGRCIRKNSHVNLPVENRRVMVRILVSTINKNYDYDDAISPELYRYIDKLNDYIVIQNIEREMNRNAIDATVNRDIIMSPGILQNYFPYGPGSSPVAQLGNLYYEPSFSVPTVIEPSLNTFRAYKYYEEEIALITLIIKRLFILNRVWTYNDLWATVRAPPMPIEVNPKLFLEHNFIIALYNLVDQTPGIIGNKKIEMTPGILLERLFDPADKYIYIGMIRYKITQLSEYYILFPISEQVVNPLNIVYIEYLEHARDHIRALIKDNVGAQDRLIIDVEAYMRPIKHFNGSVISIDKFIKGARKDANFVEKKKSFVETYSDKSVDLMPFLYEYSAEFQKKFLEEAIEWKHSKTKNANSGLYLRVIEYISLFGAIVIFYELKKYRDLAKQFHDGLFPDVGDDQPMGYVDTRSVRLYDPIEKKWLEVNKISMNRQLNYKENEIIVGVFETAEDYCKFKLRKSVLQITEDVKKHKIGLKSDGAHRTTLGDTRLIERGIVCSTKSKYELLKIIANLGISVAKLDKTEVRIRHLCSIIKKKLIESEIRERKKDSRYKYIYSWWDDVVDISSRI